MSIPRAIRSHAPSASAVRPGRRAATRILRWTERLLACVGLCFLLYSLSLELTVMTSDSMAPTLQGTTYDNGDRILLEKLSRHWRSPKRWEIYHYFDDEGTPVMKRVVGLPGERIAIRNGKIWINGAELPQPSQAGPIRYFAYGNLANGQEVDCREGYFMLGDASIDSLDSRFTGVVTKDRLRGRAWCVVSPAVRRGWVH